MDKNEKEKQVIRWEKHYSDGSVEYTDLESSKNFIDNLSSIDGIVVSRSYLKMKPVEWMKTEGKNFPISSVRLSLIEKPTNEIQIGWNFAMEALIAKIEVKDVTPITFAEFKIKLGLGE